MAEKVRLGSNLSIQRWHKATPALFYTTAKEFQLTSEFYGHLLSENFKAEKQSEKPSNNLKLQNWFFKSDLF